MILQIGGQKGGSGKSNIAINLAAYFATKNIDVVLVDTDKGQTSSAKWAYRRSSREDAKKVHCVLSFDDIRPSLKDLKMRYELVIVDSGGRDSTEFRTGLLEADICIVPFVPSAFDLDTLPYVDDIVKETKIYNQGLAAYALLSNCPQHKKARENRVQGIDKTFDDLPNIKLLELQIVTRIAYLDTASSGLGVTEGSSTLAAQEITQLAEAIYHEQSRR